MWFQELFFKYATGIILVLIIILLLYNTAPFFYPLLWFIAAILLPILFSTLLYYILRPIVRFLEKWIPRYVSVFLIYFIVTVILFIIIFTFGSRISTDTIEISALVPQKIESFKSNINQFLNNFKNYIPIAGSSSGAENLFFEYLQKFNVFMTNLLVNMITTLANIAIGLALTPFVLYYFLVDDVLLPKFILRYVPSQFSEEVQQILKDIDTALSQFILAQMTVALVIGSILFIGYLLIGIPHALALALFAMIFYIIPILGTFIAIIPALFVALSISLSMALKVIIVMFVAHFIESNLITPKLMGQRLNIHPLTIILLLLAAGSLYGLLGLLLVTPTYAILKVIVWNIYKISRLRYTMAKIKAEVEAESVEPKKT